MAVAVVEIAFALGKVAIAAIEIAFAVVATICESAMITGSEMILAWSFRKVTASHPAVYHRVAVHSTASAHSTGMAHWTAAASTAASAASTSVNN
jgi:hypothetical protein